MRNKIGPIFLTALLSLYAVLFAPHTWAEGPKTEAENIWTRDKLTGDWWGGRTWLSKHGIDLDLRLSQYYQGVTSGGVDTNSEYGGTMDYRLNVDGHKLGLWQGFSVNMHARTRFGYDINADAGSLVLPNAGMMMPLPGDYHGTDITGLLVSQNFSLFEKPANVVIGKIDAIDAVTGFFPNLGYGQEGFWNVNALVSAMPWFGAVQGLSLYGGIGVTVNPEYKMADNGILITGTTNVSDNWGSVSDAFEDVWVAGFHRFFWKMDDQPGYFMVFVGASTKEQASNEPLDYIGIPGSNTEFAIKNNDEKKPWDVALYVYQEFWKSEDNPARKATFFMGGTLGPDNPQFAQWNWFANVELFGAMKSRPHDRMGTAVWWNGLSPSFKDLVAPLEDLRNTYGLELYYNFAIIPSVHFSPDLQLVKNQNEGDDTAVILGARLVMDF